MSSKVLSRILALHGGSLRPLYRRHILSFGAAGLPCVRPTSSHIWSGAYVWFPCCDDDFTCLQAGPVKVPGHSSPLLTCTVLLILGPIILCALLAQAGLGVGLQLAEEQSARP